MKCIDWSPETASLLDRLQQHGFKIVKVDNGEDVTWFHKTSREAFIEECMACDESRLYVISPVDQKQKGIYLVYGNSPGELICDYHVDTELDKVCVEHHDAWCETPQVFKYI